MTRAALLRPAMILLVALGSVTALRAADEPTNEPAPPAGRPTQTEIRERFKNLPPKERIARLEALRDKGGPGAAAADAILKRRAEMQKLRDEIKDLPQDQRQARIREWREKNPPGMMSAEERQALRKMFQKRMEGQIANLNKKKADGSINEEESRRLQNMERMLKRFESGPDLPPGLPPLGLPPPSSPAVQPSKPDEPAKTK